MTTYSIHNSLVSIIDKSLSGVIVALPVQNLKKSAKNEIRSFFRLKKNILSSILYVARIIFRLKIARYYPKLNNDEYFISNIAVFKQCRGKGIATQLLKAIELQAKEHQFKKLSLYVETDNPIAINVYTKFGFYVESSSTFPTKYQKYGIVGFSKMVKNV